MMNRDRNLTLVCAGDFSRWNRISGNNAVIAVRNAALLTEAVHHGVHESGKDIQRVIYDRSITAKEFLAILSELPQGFRGDVLFIPVEGRAYLSAVAPRGDGRAMYALSAEDVEFYVEAVFEESAMPAPMEMAVGFVSAA